METDHKHQVMSEIVNAIGTGPDVTLADIEARLGWLYVQHQNAGDHQAMVQINAAWSQVQTVAQTAETAVNLAAAAREMLEITAFQRDEALNKADELVKERDAAQEERDDLVEALESGDIDHPQLSGFAEMVNDMVWEDVEMNGIYVSSDPADDVQNNAMIDVTRDQADIFFDCLTGQRLYMIDDYVADALRTELAQFITQFVRKVADAERQRAAEMSQEDEY